MSEEKRLYIYKKRLEKLALWQLVVLFVMSLVISATLLRLNNIGMLERRNAVYTADESGNKQIISDRLLDLARYVSAHMNADPGSIFLENSYNQDYNKALEATSKAVNANVHKQIDTLCKSRYPSNWTAYFQCFVDQLNKTPQGQDIVKSPQLPLVASYTHSYVSPLWSLDFAGISILVSFVILLLIIAKIISYLILYIMIKKHKNVL